MSINPYAAMSYPAYPRPMATSFQPLPLNPIQQYQPNISKQPSSKFNWVWKIAGGLAGCFALERFGMIAELLGCILGYATVDMLLKVKEENIQLKAKLAQNQNAFFPKANRPS